MKTGVDGRIDPRRKMGVLGLSRRVLLTTAAGSVTRIGLYTIQCLWASCPLSSYSLNVVSNSNLGGNALVGNIPLDHRSRRAQCKHCESWALSRCPPPKRPPFPADQRTRAGRKEFLCSAALSTARAFPSAIDVTRFNAWHFQFLINFGQKRHCENEKLPNFFSFFRQYKFR